jgi:hypothetical protein
LQIFQAAFCYIYRLAIITNLLYILY